MTCIYVLLLKQEKVFLSVESLGQRNRDDPGDLQRVFSKKIHALKGVWSSCLFSLTTQQSTFEFQTQRWLLLFIFHSDHKTLLSTFTLLQPSPGSPELESSPCFSCCCCSNSPFSYPVLRSSLDQAGKAPCVTWHKELPLEISWPCSVPTADAPHSSEQNKEKIFMKAMLSRRGVWLRIQYCHCDHSR